MTCLWLSIFPSTVFIKSKSMDWLACGELFQVDGKIFWKVTNSEILKRWKSLLKCVCFFISTKTDRIESYEYSNPQLYLSIIFFTALLFLLPTILIYYVVFASVSKVEIRLKKKHDYINDSSIISAATWTVLHHLFINVDSTEIVVFTRILHRQMVHWTIC